MGRDPRGLCLGVAVPTALLQGGGSVGWGAGGAMTGVVWGGTGGRWGCWSKRI